MSEPKILKYDQGIEREVSAFQVQDLRSPGPLVHQTPSLRASQAAQGQKERRFQYDPLLRDVLSTDEETERLIESKVEEKLAELRDQTLQTAHEEGFKKGSVEGFNQAKTEFEEKANVICAQLDQLLTSVEGRKAELYETQARFLQEMMFRFAETILRREITTDKEFLKRTVSEIMDRVGAREMVKILVHPSQLENIYSVVPELEKKFASLRSVSVEATDQIKETDCVVETDFNRVDATLQTQLLSLHELLGTKS